MVRIADLLRSRGQPTDDFDRSVGVCRALLDWMEMPYYQRFMAYLQSEADRPAEIGQHMDMIVSSTRSNTFREILQKLRNDADRARVVLEENDG